MRTQYRILTLLALGAAAVVVAAAVRPAAEPPANTSPESPRLVASDADANEKPPRGRWHRNELDASDPIMAEAIAELESIGYMAGSVEATELSSVTQYDADRAYNGYNLYCSGHGPEAILADMHGEPIHSWRYTFEEAFPGEDGNRHVHFWRRVRLLPDGGLLAIYEGHGIIRIDKESNLVWALNNGAHHDIDIDGEGYIYTLTREIVVDERVHEERPIFEEFVVVVSPEGETIRKVSLLDAFENSDHYAIVQANPPNFRKYKGDHMHNNTIEIIDERHAAIDRDLRPGQVLIAALHFGAVYAVDLETESVVWAEEKDWGWIHEPQLLPGGNLLLYENLANETENAFMSRVVEYDLVEDEVHWRYQGSGPDTWIFSPTCGTAHRLPNGNTLITASDSGRAIEVTPEKEIVWEFYNPHRAGDDNEFVATLFHVKRLPPDLPLAWAEESES